MLTFVFLFFALSVFSGIAPGLIAIPILARPLVGRRSIEPPTERGNIDDDNRGADDNDKGVDWVVDWVVDWERADWSEEREGCFVRLVLI
jgi:hypothetical protein